MAGPWGLVIGAPDGATLDLVGDATTVRSAHPSLAEAIAAAQLDNDRLIVLSAARPAPPPQRILPDVPGDLGGLVQERPLTWLSAEQRIMLAGVVAQDANWDGIVCLAGGEATHWVHLSAGEIVSFQAAATGRLIAALGGSGGADETALSDTQSRPERLAIHVQSAALAGDGAAVTGHLVGAELVAMRAYWLGQEVRVIADTPLYCDALAVQGMQAARIAPDGAWLAGLQALARKAGVGA